MPLGIEGDAEPVFGWKARVPLSNGRFDRTEVDLQARLAARRSQADRRRLSRRAKLPSWKPTATSMTVFDRELLPRVELFSARRKEPVEFPEAWSQEFESVIDTSMPRLQLQNELQAQSPSALAAEASQLQSSQRPRLRKLSTHPQCARGIRRGLQLLRAPRRAQARLARRMVPGDGSGQERRDACPLEGSNLAGVGRLLTR